MGKINKVNKQTTNPYLNIYDLDVVNKVGREGHYYVASRAKTEDDLKLSHIENNDPDGVAIYSLYGEKKDRVVLIRQFRYPLGIRTLELPQGSRVLFLPQRPYLPLGTLRRAIWYPLSAQGSEERLTLVLRMVGMEKVISQLDVTDDWSRILSLGEQQRIAFARVLLVKPQWVFLDEATSALDEPREQAMYELLRRELPETSVISVGHRSTLFAQHERELHLTGDGGWKLRPIEG